MLDEENDVAFIQLTDEPFDDPEHSSYRLLPPTVSSRVDVFWDSRDRVTPTDRKDQRDDPLQQSIFGSAAGPTFAICW
jgi:hypothetical protein